MYASIFKFMALKVTIYQDSSSKNINVSYNDFLQIHLLEDWMRVPSGAREKVRGAWG